MHILKIIEECDIIDYNVRPPGGGLKGLEELDVIGINFKTNTAYLCKATTQIRGALISNNKKTVEKIEQKHNRQNDYAKKYLSNFANHRYIFLSPVVPVGSITSHLENIKNLEKIINKDYKDNIEKLKEIAKIQLKM